MEGIVYAKEHVTQKTAKNPAYIIQTDQTDRLTITLCDSAQKALGSIQLEKAIDSDLAKSTTLKSSQLANCAIIYATNADDTLLPVLCYLALRQARMWDCQNIITADNSAEFIKLLKLAPLTSHPHLHAQRLSYSIIQCYAACNNAVKSFLKTQFVHEVMQHFQNWLEVFFKDSWFSAIANRTMTKEQYVMTLYNLHQFVKHTTRLAARCVAYCDNKELRNHYLNHLQGEINHELIIESDLKGLGADVDYVLNDYVANLATSAFITTQESAIGYKQDPILMLACPFIAEGMTANIDNRVVDNLHEIILSWGITKPQSVSRFLTSHMKTDGGVDGHWLRVVVMIAKYVQSEQQLQQFLNVMHLAMSGYAKGFNDNINELTLWQTSRCKESQWN